MDLHRFQNKWSILQESFFEVVFSSLELFYSENKNLFRYYHHVNYICAKFKILFLLFLASWTLFPFIYPEGAILFFQDVQS